MSKPMKLAGRIPVDPLDDERLTKIERRVVMAASEIAPAAASPLRSSRRAFGFAVAAFAMACAAIVGWKLRASRPDAPAIAEAIPITVHTEHPGVGSTIDIGDATIESGDTTVFTVTRPDGGVLVTMTRGKVSLAVGKRGDRPPLVVRAGDTDVIVVGTHFSVDYGDGHGDVDVRVSEGVVRVRHADAETRVAAGYGWKTGGGLTALTAMTAMTEPDRVDRVDRVDPTRAGEPHSTTDDPVTPSHAGLHGRVPVVPDSARHDAAAGSGAPDIHHDAADHSYAMPNRNDPSSKLRIAIGEVGFAPALDVGETEATAMIRKYYAIINGREKQGLSIEQESRALYSVAVIDHLRLGRNDDALAWLDAYMRRFAGKKKPPEYADAMWLRIRIECKQSINERCRAAAAVYLHEDHPEGPAAEVAGRIVRSI